MRRWVLAPLALCYLAIVSGVAAAPEARLPDAQTLRARMAAATGAPNGNYRETIVGAGDDGPIVSMHFHRGKDALVTMDRGSVRTRYGTYRGDDWHTSANGITVADVRDPGLVAPVKTTTTVRRRSSPLGAFVLSKLDRSGYGSRDYVDSASYLLLRHDEIGAAGTTTTTYGTYAHFGTQVLPASWRVNDRPFNETMTYTRTQFVLGATSERDVAQPPWRRIVSLPAGTAAVDLHAHFADGQITIPVAIAGRTFFFLLDSGASAITIDPAVAKQLGLALGKRNQEVAGKRFETHDTVIPTMAVAGLRMRDIVALTVPLGAGRTPSDPAGLLGFDFLAQLAVHIDYKHKRVLAMDARSYQPPRGADVSALDVRLGSQVPVVSANLGGAVAERLIVDTGSGSALLLFNYFARRHGEVLRSPLDSVLQSIDPASGVLTGIGGEFKSRPYRMPYVRIGQFSIADLIADVVTSSTAYPQDNDGLIGSDLLQSFTVDLDYAGGRIFLRPNESVN